MNARAPLITQSEYARRRGVAKSAVARAVKEGRIVLIDGKVNEQVANAMWDQNTRARADSGRAGGSNAGGDGGTPVPGAQAPGGDAAGSAPAAPGYSDFRTRREAADAEKAEIELNRLRGRLVDRDTVERAVFDGFRQLRDAIFNVPQRAAPRVVGIADARDVEVAMAEELRKAFDGWEARMLERLPAKDAAA